VVLEATLADGTKVEGESRISKSRARIERIRLKPSRVKPMQETLDALARADLITLGPGSLFTSIVPNVLVNGISEAIEASPATKLCFMNLMWQPGETIDFAASDHIAAIERHAGRKLIDVVALNTAPISSRLQRQYAEKFALPVENDLDSLAKLGVRVIARPLAARGAKIRHDPRLIAEIAVQVAGEGRRRRARRVPRASRIK
jgi:uncharacterized cofD-like protein